MKRLQHGKSAGGTRTIGRAALSSGSPLESPAASARAGRVRKGPPQRRATAAPAHPTRAAHTHREVSPHCRQRPGLAACSPRGAPRGPSARKETHSPRTRQRATRRARRAGRLLPRASSQSRRSQGETIARGPASRLGRRPARRGPRGSTSVERRQRAVDRRCLQSATPAP